MEPAGHFQRHIWLGGLRSFRATWETKRKRQADETAPKRFLPTSRLGLRNFNAVASRSFGALPEKIGFGFPKINGRRATGSPKFGRLLGALGRFGGICFSQARLSTSCCLKDFVLEYLQRQSHLLFSRKMRTLGCLRQMDPFLHFPEDHQQLGTLGDQKQAAFGTHVTPLSGVPSLCSGGMDNPIGCFLPFPKGDVGFVVFP